MGDDGGCCEAVGEAGEGLMGDLVCDLLKKPLRMLALRVVECPISGMWLSSTSESPVRSIVSGTSGTYQKQSLMVKGKRTEPTYWASQWFGYMGCRINYRR